MAGLLGDFGNGMRGLLGNPTLRDAFLLTVASGADPKRSDALIADRLSKEEAKRLEEYRNLQMDQARMQMEQAKQAQQRQQQSQGALASLSLLAPEYQAMYRNDPAFQQAFRANQVAYGDPAAAEQSGLLAPLPSSQEEPSIVRTIRAMGGDPQDPKWQAVIMQSLVKPQTSINMGAQFPDLPKDHMWVNPLNPAEGVKPIPNSPTDLSQRAAAEKEGTGTGNTIARIDNVMSELDRAISGVGYTTTGLIGAATKNLPGSPAKDLSGSLTTIKANIGFNELQAMREASPTGGALGQVAVQELEALQSVLASLEQDQSPERVAENLNKVKNHYARWRSIVEQAKQNGQGAPIVPNSSPSQSGGRVVDFNSLP